MRALARGRARSNVSDPRVSVVVATRGRPEALTTCVSALVGQEPPEGGIEIVVVDDGDGLPHLPATVVALAGDGSGPAAARNLGAKAARGAVLAFTDDDCVPSPRWAHELDAAVRAHPGAGVAGVTLNGLPDDVFAIGSQLVLDASHTHFAVEGKPRFVASCNLALPAAAFHELGGFDRSFRHAEDRDLCARWHASGRSFVWAPGAQVVHRRTMGTASFISQHAGYGRGAYALHRRMSGSGLVPSPQPGFYGVLAEQVRRAPERRGRLSTLAALSQVAAAFGFALEATATRYGIGRRSCAEPSLPMPVPRSDAQPA